jgi:pSer/pThr/pTyr-binding forkhead associated (FHA) protein
MYLIVGHAEKPEAIALTRDPISIGRSLDNDVSLPDDLLSRNHCTIGINNSGKVELIDLDSRNGCMVNGVSVSQTILELGDLIKLGVTALVVVESPLHKRSLSSETMSWNQGPSARVSHEKLRDVVISAFQTLYCDGGTTSTDSDSRTLCGLIEASTFERGMLLEINAAGQVSVRLAYDLGGSNLEGDDLTLDQAIVDEMLAQQSLIHVVGKDQRAFGEQMEMVDLNIRSALSLPIFADEESEDSSTQTVRGALYFDSRVGNPAFNPEDITLFIGFANYFAKALARNDSV